MATSKKGSLQRKPLFRCGSALLLKLIALLILVCFSSRLIASTNLSFKHIFPEELEVLGHINSIQQDATGFMWFAGEKGLARYDGYTIKIYRTDSGELTPIAANYITDLFLDGEDLWISSRIGLHLYVEDLDSFKNYRTDIDSASQGIGYVNAICSNGGDKLWLATNGGVFTFDKRSKYFSVTPIDHAIQKQKASIVWDLTFDNLGKLWVAYESLGLSSFGGVNSVNSVNSFDGEVQRYRHDTQDVSSISSNNVRQVYVDSKNRVWAGTYGDGLNLIDRESAQVVRFPHENSEKSGVIWSVLEGKDGRIWVGDGESVSVLNVESRNFRRFIYSDEIPTSPGNFVANVVYEDNNGNVWVGYFPSGVDIVDAQASVFNNFRHRSSKPNTIADGGALATFRDENDNLWVGAGLGLSYLDRETGKISNFKHVNNNLSTPSGNTVLSVIEDSKGYIWLGIWNAGLNRYDPKAKTFDYFLPIEGDETSIPGREPWDVIEDSRGDIWLATEKGIAKYHREQKRFTRYKPPQNMLLGADSFYCRKAYEDRSQQLWFGCVSGLYLLDQKSGVFTHYKHEKDKSASISDSYVISIFEDSKNRFWVGTSDGGLNLMDRKTGTFQVFSIKDGLANKTVAGINEDSNGFIWLATNKGLSQFDPESLTFRNYGRRHGLIDNLFNRDSISKTGSGELVVGSSKGLTIFRPEDLKSNHFKPPVVITDFKVFNESHPVNAKGEPVVDKNIVKAREINLAHWQSMFSFKFSALNYISPEDNQFKYRLLGFEEEWRRDVGSRMATYTNIDPGAYTFQVIGSNNEGLWNTEPASIKVIIAPPFWKTWWAYAIYSCVGVVLFVLLVNYYRRKVELNKQKFVNTQLLNMDKIKDEFLASTSHELRTPLIAMIGLSDTLVSEYSEVGDKNLLEKLDIISLSGQRLCHLINDILDYSKIKGGRLELNVTSVNIDGVVESVFSLLRLIAASKGLALKYSAIGQKCYVQADDNRLQQIIINLVGNAIKYSDSGTIEVICRPYVNSLKVLIVDQGIGIPEQKLSTIFETFRQLEFSQEHNVGGTGLGLSITKKLVELHGGELKVRSTVGEGSEFEFTLPLDPDRQLSHQSDHSQPLDADFFPLETSSSQESVPVREVRLSDGEFSMEGKVLVVDDDPVNRMIILGYLKKQGVQTLECENGHEAVAFVKRDNAIRLLVMDNMMPGLSGVEACKEIRLTHSLEQLPIFLLSAVKLDDKSEDYFAIGFNEFIQKPVSASELLSKVKYHLSIPS
ncbi:MAG: two-component system sensor histidine kinase ChiS [Flavobacteriales bacterium]|jgi:two-component system sensor histidine kinase ChiS